MKRSLFGDPRPEGMLEIHQALEELGVDPDSVDYVEIERDDDGFGSEGWCATLQAGEVSVDTLAYDSRDELVEDLSRIGVKVELIP